MTPRSKHIAVKYHWFRSHLQEGEIEVRRIDTKVQKADIFTKGLARREFEDKRSMIMGSWTRASSLVGASSPSLERESEESRAESWDSRDVGKLGEDSSSECDAQRTDPVTLWGTQRSDPVGVVAASLARASSVE